jgi:putative membrane protein
MYTLAHLGDAAPGAWILFFPLVWAAVVLGGITLLRRTAWRGHGTSGRPSPLTVLGHRFASGEIDEEEYWRRLSVLEEQFGRGGGGGGK